MHDPFAMCRGQRLGDLHSQPQGIGHRYRTLQRRTFDVLHHQVVWPDVVELTDAGMIQRRDRASFALETLAVLCLETFDRDGPIDSRVPGLPDLAHAPLA